MEIGALPSTLGEAARFGRAAVRAVEAGGLTAEVLLAHAAGLSRTQVLAHPERALPAEQAAAYAALLARAAAGEPLAYLTGEREFFGLAFAVDRRVLVPRPETELLVERALAAEDARRKTQEAGGQPEEAAFRVVDVGAGSGCIAVTLAVKRPAAQVTAVDCSAEALAVTAANARRHGVLDRVQLVRGDLLAALAGPFDLLCANLPYIATGELAELAVGRHEPRLALDGGPDGLALVRRLLADAPRVMRPGGRLLLEIGAGQGPAAQTAARAVFPGAQIAVHPDLAGLDRVLEVAL